MDHITRIGWAASLGMPGPFPLDWVGHFVGMRRLRALEAVMRYFSASERVEEKDLHEALTSVFPDEGEKLMVSMAEKYMKKGIQEGIQEGKRQGSTEMARENLLGVLEARFGNVPVSVAERIREVEDVGLLRGLHKKAVTIESLERFQGVLEGVSVG